MFDDLDETISQLLKDELPIKNGEIDISFDQPTGDWGAGLSKPTLNLFLYDVRENNTLRQHGWERLPDGDGRAHMKRMPMRVDVTYMLTAWAAIPEDEHSLLARCMMVLFRFPILPEDRLKGDLRNPPFDIQASVARHDKLTNPAEVWSALENKMRPSISYIVTLALDAWKEIKSTRFVTTRSLRAGQSLVGPEDPNLLSNPKHRNSIGGKVMDGSQGGQPVSGIQVAVKGTGLVAITDKDGIFVLGGLPAGKYTLVASPPQAKPREKVILVPDAGAILPTDPEKEGQYDMVI